MKKYQSGTHSENLLTTKTNKRQGDWVCMMCNNLNYSFRNSCNRCKNITRQQNSNLLVKSQKERQPLGELIPLNRHSSYKQQIHKDYLDSQYDMYMSESKKQYAMKEPVSVNEFIFIEPTVKISQFEGFASKLYLTPTRYCKVEEQDEKEEDLVQDGRSPFLVISPLLRALKDEINCQN